MRKLYLLMLALAAGFFAHAQISGIKSIPGDYPTIAAAIADLNANGVGGGGVTFNVAAGHTESSADSVYLTASGTSANPVVFQKSGAGANPLVTRTGSGLLSTSTLGAAGDAVLIIHGSDYITFNGIDVSTADQGIEYGYLLRKASATDGCKNVTITNASITMTKGTSAYVIGIYVSNNFITQSTSSATGIVVTTTDGRNENITITRNTISNVFAGIVARGYNASTPYDLYDQNLVVGGSAGNGNTIQNVAGNASSTSYCVYLIYQNDAVISYNTINNTAGGGSGATSTFYGIFMSTGTTSNFTANNNIVDLTSSASSSGLYGIYNSSGSGAITINNNTVTLNNTAASSATYGYIYNGNSHAGLSISGNNLVGTTLNKTSTTYLIYNSTSTSNNSTITNNQISGNLVLTGTSGTLYGYYDLASPTGTTTFSGNNFSNITVGGSTTLYGFHNNTTGAHTLNVFNNTFSNLTAGTGTLYGISGASSNNKNIYNNEIHSNTGSGTVYGIYNSSGSGIIYKNKIYNLTANTGSGVVYGMGVAGGASVTLLNNLIGDLKAPASSQTAPAPSVAGLYLTGGTAVNVYHNTINIAATSTGTNFGTAAVYSNATPAVSLINNIFVNTSTANGTGRTIGFQRTTATLTNYSTGSNNNDFYIGTPSATNVFFYDGTTAFQTLAAFKTQVVPRESSSISELPPFISTAGASPDFLHITAGATTGIESGGVNLPGITEDYDGDIRAGNTGYTGSGFAPDMGADEFAGVPTGVPCAAPVDQPSSLSFGTTTSTSQPASFTAAASTPTGYLVIRSEGPLNGLPDNGTSYANGSAVGVNGTAVASISTPSFTASGLTNNTNYTYTIFSYNSANCIGGPVYNVTAPLTGSSTTCAGVATALTNSAITTSGFTLNWTAPTGGTAAPLTYTVEVATESAFTNIVSTQNVSVTTANITGLNSATQYYYRVRASNGICEGNNSSSGNLFTACTPGTLPLFEGFNTSSTTANPLCWSKEIVAIQTSSKISYQTTGTDPTTSPYEGTRMVRYNSFSSTGGTAGSEERLISRTLNTTGIPSVDVEFYWRNNHNTSYSSGAYLNESVQVQYSLDNGVTWVNAGAPIPRHDGSLAAGTAQWNKKTVTLPAAAGNQAAVLVGFLFHSEYGDNMFMDAVNIFATPSCITPTGVSVGSITDNSASVSFNCASCTGSFIVEYGPLGFTPGTGATAGTGGTVVTGTASPIALSGLSQNMLYQVYVRQDCGAGSFSANSNVLAFTTACSPLTLTSTTPGSRCGIGTTTLQATAPAGASILWYTTATGGAPVFTGTSFTTPVISTTTTYYAEALVPGGSFNIGEVSDAAANLSSLSNYGMYFSTQSSATINTVDIYPSTAGTLTISLKDGSGATVDTRVFTIDASEISNTVKKTLALNFTVPAGATGWQIYHDLAIYRGDRTYSYPYIVGGFSITGNTLDGNNITGGSRFYFYNWNVTTNCTSTRTAVVATVNTPPAITLSATPPAICAGQSSTISVSSANTGYTYVWEPGNLQGASQVVTPAATTMYVVTATDNSGGANNSCVAIDSILVSVNALPAAPVVNASSSNVCAGTVVTLTSGSGPSTAIVGTGTSTNTTTGYPSPYTNYYGGTKHQMLIRASELTALGLSAGSSITSIQFDVAAVGSTFSGTLLNFQIDMGHTSETVLNNTAFVTGLTNALPAASHVVTIGLNTHTLSVPFVWDGVNNVVIQTSYSNNNSGATSDNVQMRYTASGFNSTSYYRADNATAATILAEQDPTGVTANRPNMILGVGTANTITWSPVTGLFTDAAATVPYTAGTNTAVVYAAPTATETYTATVTTLSGCTSTGNATITIKPATSISSQPAAQTVCTGSPANFSVTATGDGTLTYQWQLNGTDISGATSATLNIANATAADAGNYTVVVTGSCGSVTSTAAALTVDPSTSITTQPASQTVCAGDNTSFTVTASGTGLNYQWRKNGSDITGATSATLSINGAAASDAATYDVIVTGTCGTVTSTAVTLTVNAATAITTQPAAQTACLGGNVSFTIAANGTGLTYQWRKNGADITGATNATYTITGVAAADAANYDVVVTGTCGSVTSAAVALTITTATSITTQPVAQAACLGGNITFSVTAAGDNLSYQWRKGGSNIAGATSASYTINGVVAGDAANYDVVVTGTCGSVTSNAVALTINAATAITTQPTGGGNLCFTNSRTFTVTATGTGLTYQWRRDNTPIAGATNSSYTITNAGLADAGTYDVVVTGTCGSVTSSSVIINITACTAVPPVDPVFTEARLLPNRIQSSSILRVVSTRTAKITWTITDMQGRIVKRFEQNVTNGTNDYLLQVAELASGMYQLHGSSANGKVTTLRFTRF